MPGFTINRILIDLILILLFGNKEKNIMYFKQKGKQYMDFPSGPPRQY